VVAGWVSLIIYVGIFLMSSLPASALPAHIPDIIPHCCEYFILAFFFIQMFSNPADGKTMAAALVLLILLGLLDEWHQAFVPGRFCSLKDLLFDALGSLSGLTAARILQRWSAKKHANRWARRLGDYFFRT
jgi:VanZ family protein